MDELREWLKATPVLAVHTLAGGADRLRRMSKDEVVEYILSEPELRRRAEDSRAAEEAIRRWAAEADPWERRCARIRYGLVD